MKKNNMQKNILILALSILIISCSSVKQARQSINKGNYTEAINLAVKKLQNNKSKKGNQPYILMLKEAFDKAVLKDNEQITFLSKENNPEKIEALYNLYVKLSERQKKIQPLLPLTLKETNKEVVFDLVNYQNDLVETQQQLVAHLYSKSLLDLKAKNLSKLDYRAIHEDLNYVQKLSPNYKNVNRLLNTIHQKGTDIVYVTLQNETDKVIPKRLEEDLLNFDTYRLNDFWTVYHVKKDKTVDYDYQLQLNFRNINVSPERVNEKELIREKEVEETVIVKDSLGKKVESVKIVRAICTIYQITQTKTCEVRGNVKYIDLKNNNQIIENFPLVSGYVFTHVYGNYRGDKRALNDSFLQIIRAKEVPFPSNEQMIYDTGKDLKNKLRNIFTKNNFR